MCDQLFSQHHLLLTLQAGTLDKTLFSMFAHQKEAKCNNLFDFIDLRWRLLSFRAFVLWFPIKFVTFCQPNLLTWQQLHLLVMLCGKFNTLVGNYHYIYLIHSWSRMLSFEIT